MIAKCDDDDDEDEGGGWMYICTYIYRDIGRTLEGVSEIRVCQDRGVYV